MQQLPINLIKPFISVIQNGLVCDSQTITWPSDWVWYRAYMLRLTHVSASRKHCTNCSPHTHKHGRWVHTAASCVWIYFMHRFEYAVNNIVSFNFDVLTTADWNEQFKKFTSCTRLRTEPIAFANYFVFCCCFQYAWRAANEQIKPFNSVVYKR